MTIEPESSIEELIGEVQQAVAQVVDHTNSDLLALTVDVEILRRQLQEAVTSDVAEQRRRGTTVSLIGAGFLALQVTDAHEETCRVDPLIGRFQRPPKKLDNTSQFFCDVSFPTHNHGPFEKVGHGLSGANYLGVVIYTIIGLSLIAWWIKAKLKVKKNNKRRFEEIDSDNVKRRLIYTSPQNVAVVELDNEGKETLHSSEKKTPSTTS